MRIRVTDSSMAELLTDRIQVNQQRLNNIQERLSSGKRINRPSDDPFGTEAVLRFRTAQATVEQFERVAAGVKDGLQVADSALESQQQQLDRVKALLAQGASDSTSASAKQSIAAEIDVIRTQMLNIARQSYQGVVVFGGTRQGVPPYDANGNPALAPTSTQMVQIEPGGTPIAAGVTANTVFENAGGTVFAALASASAALRGTGNANADRATILAQIDNMTQFNDLAGNARSTLGASMVATDNARARLQDQSLSYQAGADNYEAADIAAEAVQLSQASNALDATLKSTALRNRGSLLDLIG